MTLRPFHLAFPVRDLAEARAFWGGVIGCPEGRSAADWVDFDFYGHQIVAHLAPDVSGSRLVLARLLAIIGNVPTLILVPPSSACSWVRPTPAISGEV